MEKKQILIITESDNISLNEKVEYENEVITYRDLGCSFCGVGYDEIYFEGKIQITPKVIEWMQSQLITRLYKPKEG